MKNIRQVLMSAVVAIGAFSSILYVGCKDKCGSTTCQNGAACSENICVCPTGYSGSDCGTSWTSKYTGTYNCTKNCGTGTWVSTITADATYGGYTLDISDFDGTNATYYATVDSTTHITMEPATGAAGFAASGTYSLNSDNKKVLVLNFTSVDTTHAPVGTGCTMTMTQQ